MALSFEDAKRLIELIASDSSLRLLLRAALGDGSAGADGNLGRAVFELTEAVKELAKAQSKTEKVLGELGGRVDALSARMEELAAAQARTEARMDSLAVRMEELAVAQARTEARMDSLAARMDSLAARMEELAAAQARTEARIDSLAARMDSLAARMEELAVAQARTEQTVAKLAEAHEETRRQLGGLSATVGYTLENEAYKALPRLLERDYGVHLAQPLRRRFVEGEDGTEYEVNIGGEATRDGEAIVVVGEAKAQLSANDVDRFLRRKVRPLSKIFPNPLFPVLATHMTTGAGVEQHAKERDVVLYFSYDFE